jgi:hypothetical protein
METFCYGDVLYGDVLSRRRFVRRRFVDVRLWTRVAPDTDFAGYPVNLKAGYRISGAGRLTDIRCRPYT